MESSPTLNVNPIYSALDNSAIDKFMGYINMPEDQWNLFKEPKKDKDPKVFAWRRVEKGAKTEICMKTKMYFPDINID